MPGTELSRVRTELERWRIVATIPPHPVQAYGHPAIHGHFGNATGGDGTCTWLFFATSVVQTSSNTSYLDFERAFPVADGWLAFASARCAINCARRRPQAVLWALVASGASVYLGCMDTLYNLEHGKYASLDAGMILEMLINLSSVASPAILIPYFWRNRRWFGT